MSAEEPNPFVFARPGAGTPPREGVFMMFLSMLLCLLLALPLVASGRAGSVVAVAAVWVVALAATCLLGWMLGMFEVPRAVGLMLLTFAVYVATAVVAGWLAASAVAGLPALALAALCGTAVAPLVAGPTVLAAGTEDGPLKAGAVCAAVALVLAVLTAGPLGDRRAAAEDRERAVAVRAGTALVAYLPSAEGQSMRVNLSAVGDPDFPAYTVSYFADGSGEAHPGLTVTRASQSLCSLEVDRYDCDEHDEWTEVAEDGAAKYIEVEREETLLRLWVEDDGLTFEERGELAAWLLDSDPTTWRRVVAAADHR